MTVETASRDLQRRARNAYEWGRLRAAAVLALQIATGGAILSTLLIGVEAAVWAPLTFVLWLWLGWRGGAVLHGARYGLASGAFTFLLPLWVLRPCCRWNASGVVSCTMPEMCVAVGALASLPLATWALSQRESQRLQVSAGMWLGAISVATFKCSSLFMGEALGLLGGIALGMAAASAVGMVSARASQA